LSNQHQTVNPLHPKHSSRRRRATRQTIDDVTLDLDTVGWRQSDTHSGEIIAQSVVAADACQGNVEQVAVSHHTRPCGRRRFVT